MSFINDILALSHVPRWGIVRHSRQQSVAEHTFRMTMIAREIVVRCLPSDYLVSWPEFLWTCLTHDADESVTGDVPTPAKIALGLPGGNLGLVDVPDIDNRHGEPTTVAEKIIIDLADEVEAYVFLRHEGRGPHATEIGDRAHARIMKKIDDAFNRIPGFDSARMCDLINEMLKETGRIR